MEGKKRELRVFQNRIMLGFVMLVFSLVLIGACGGTSYAATKKDGWVNGYYYVNGVKQKSKWIQSGKNKYYVDSTGKKVTGWKKIGKSYYFFNEKGKIYNSSKKAGVQLTKLSSSVITMGIDVSEWQGKVNWTKVKNAGVGFVMIRVGYGKGRYGSSKCTLDKKFKEYVKGAQAAGIPIGIYFYSYATTAKQAQEEAEFVIENLDGIPVAFPVAYDIEDAYILSKTTKATRTEMARTFMETIAAAGYYPVYYCNQNWYDNYLDTQQLKDYDFWYARYTYVEPKKTAYPFMMWQATSTQKISGITENTVDIDFLYKNYSKLITTRKKALKHGWYTEAGKLRYYYKGKAKKSGWFSIAGKKYYFSNSAASTGWKTISGKKYYFNSKGEMQTGLTKIAGKRYLFSSSGVLQTTTTKQGITIDSEGVCHIKAGWYKKSNGKYFYRKSNGSIAKSQWITVKGKKYYCDSKGYRVTGFKTIKNKRYYFSKTGVMKKGWLTYKGKRYYFKSSGVMVRGKTVKIKGKKYTFDKKGVLKKK